VECRSDGDYAGRPLAISWQGQRLVVEKVLDAWRAPNGKCYRVSTQDGQVFELCYSEFDDAWSIAEDAKAT
jgi:hypothetical protein